MGTDMPTYENSTEIEKAEARILGCMMISRDVTNEAEVTINPDDFSCLRHALIFESIIKTQKESGIVDLISVMDTMIKDDVLEQCGGIKYFASLANQVWDPNEWRRDYAYIQEQHR
jgi:replicative DNA helicase